MGMVSKITVPRTQTRLFKKRSLGLIGLVLGCVCLTLALGYPSAEAKISDWFKRRPKGPSLPYSNPDAMSSQFVTFEPNNPLLYPDNLDLFHIEAKRRVLGAALLSPNRQLMATSEVTLLPQSLEPPPVSWCPLLASLQPCRST